ncbi:NACHT and WD40 repeat domain-containing protein [Actinoplanes sp. CA-015351]|uniref:NACHT and WD40 repeat domain-containing protein n=1 Tax=Actinoplanes sp. CA-015351 TaxID=3239897 RepID=UPI003D96C627
MSFNSHDRWRVTLLWSLAILTAGFAAWAVNVDLGASTAIATIVGLLLSAASLALAVLQVFPARPRSRVDAVAAAAQLGDDIRGQWLGEARARSIRAEDPILPISWTSAAARFADPEQPVNAGSGRWDGDFTTAAEALAKEYRRLPNGRVVILGDPGAGKTVVAMLLTVGLLPDRVPGVEPALPSRENPVPVLLSASSWDPVCEPMDDWVVRTVAQSHFNGETGIPSLLLESGLLLPVVDGLDEIPESARRTAVHRINYAIGQNRPIVVTCRTAEFEDAIRGGAPVLHRSPVVRVLPVAAADARRYVSSVVPDPDRNGWQQVFAAIDGEPGGPLAEALSTPLMISLLVAVYRGEGSNPEELLNPVVCHSRHAVEDHLLDHAIAVRFGGPGPGRFRCDPEKAARWLTFLAVYLHQNRERDLAWWRMSDRLLPRLTGPGVGLLLGMLVTLVSSLLGQELMGAIAEYPDEATALGATVGAMFALLFTLTWYAVDTRPPGRLSWSPAGSWHRVRRNLLVGFAIPAMPGAAVLLVCAAVLTIVGDWRYESVHETVGGLVFVAAVGCVLGAGLAADAWLSPSPERSTRPSPDRFLRDDRLSSVAGAAASAVAVALALPLLTLTSMRLGDAMAHTVASRAGLGPRPDDAAFFWRFSSGWDVARDPMLWWTVVCIGVLVGVLVLFTRAWPRFLVVRAYLAVRGRLPWRLPAFLAEARSRHLLRESGGMYQFHHVRLQERLAGRPQARAVPAPAVASVPWPNRRRRALLHAGVAMVILVAAVAVIVNPAVRSRPIRLDPPSLAGDFGSQQQVSLSRDGSLLVVTRDNVIDVWHLDLGKARGRYAGFRFRHDYLLSGIAVSADGDRIAVATTFAVYLLRADGTRIGTWPQPGAGALEFSPDGKMLAVHVNDGFLQLLSVAGNRMVRAGRQPVAGYPVTFAFWPGRRSGAVAYVACDDPYSWCPDTVVTMPAPNGLPVNWPTGHTGPMRSMVFTSDASTLVTGSSAAAIRLRATAHDGTHEPSVIATGLMEVRALALPDGTTHRIVAADTDSAEIWTIN